jgi:hypothetical protein
VLVVIEVPYISVVLAPSGFLDFHLLPRVDCGVASEILSGAQLTMFKLLFSILASYKVTFSVL